jgi:hypothetical protein
LYIPGTIAQRPSEYEVYDAYLRHLYPNGFAKLVIACATVPPDPIPTEDRIRRELPNAKADACADFERLCRQSVGLQRELFDQANCIQFTRQAVSESYGLSHLQADYPEGDGIIYLSCVGFSIDKRQALGSVETFSHRPFPSAGFGYRMLASRVRGIWQVAETEVTWIA